MLNTFTHLLVSGRLCKAHASSIPRVSTTYVLWAFKVLHIRGVDEIPGLLYIPIANGSAPIRAHIVSVGLQYKLFSLKLRVVDRATDIAHRNSKGAFPAGTLGAGIPPLVLECRLYTSRSCG